MSKEENFVPFGPEWKKEVMKMTKPAMADLIENIARENMGLQHTVNQLTHKHPVTGISNEEYMLFAKIWMEHQSAVEKHPEWPSDILHQIAIVNEEAGEATRAALQFVYEGKRIYEVKKELLQTAAICLRMLKGLNHEQ